MRRRSGLPQAALVALGGLLLGQTFAHAEVQRQTPQERRAAKLVKAALEAELAGDATGRAELLARAQQADPTYAPARWHGGQVQFDGQWLELSQVQQLVANDDRWQEYRELRVAATDDPVDQAELARWCMRKGLAAEERVHWTKVLQADPYHEQARDRMGLAEYRGALYTHQQVAELKATARQAERDFERFKPTFTKLARQAASGPPAEREAALAKLREVSDPAALEALEYAVRKFGRGERSTRDLHHAMVTALGNMPEHQATCRLLDYAVFATDEDIRYAAIAALRPRPMTDYVPLLMAALSAPIEAEIDVHLSPDGTVTFGQNIRQAGPEADRAIVQNRDYVAVAGINQRGETRSIWPAAFTSFRTASAVAWNAQRRVEAANAATREQNERIEQVLLNATELRIPAALEADARPQAWWQAWFEHNELYSESHPTYEVVDNYTQYAYIPPPVIPSAMSCFAAGTPVWTQAGPVPIERITAGDLVLSQDPASGELGYRPVLQTTLRPPTRMVDIKLPEETITATAGHRFWINGHGWQMAKFLTASSRLHAVDGPVDIAAVDKHEEVEAHNLVVDDFHTYFVGQSRILVHDNNCPRPTTASVPGGVASK